MSANNAHANTPAAAWAWLSRQLSKPEEMPGRSINREWTKFESEVDGRGTKGTSLIDWPSDFWIAKTQQGLGSTLEPVWAIPERLDQWPTLEIQNSFVGTLLGRRTTNSASLLDLLARTDHTPVLTQSVPVRRFLELDESSTTHGDQAMISAHQIRAWLTTAFGNLLTGIALTPTDEDQTREIVVREVAGRISDIDFLPFEDRRNSWLDYGCETLYTTQMTRSGLQVTVARQGQGRDWQAHWGWLSTPQGARAMEATLQLAGLLLMNEPLLSGLTSTIRDGNEDAKKRTLCVTRRWLLTAKVLAWLFGALQHNWTWVRPQDLACFAFGSLSPAWPRRAFAVSHRSAEAKPILTRLKMWRSPHAAIDASYVPAWETNTGMIWSLFASVPLIVRVESPAYFESEWCRRENEMFQYLIEHEDFLEGRAIVDIGVDQLEELDISLFEDGGPRSSSSRFKPFSAPRNQFPPLSLVLVGAVPSRIDLAILRAAGALRLIHTLVQNPARANEVARHAAAGDDIGIEAPTNNPDGWAAYGEAFRDLEDSLLDKSIERGLGAPRRSLSLRLPDDYSALDLQQDLVRARQIPDLSDGEYRLSDVLAALEWQRTVFDWFVTEGLGDKVLVDLTISNVEEWSTLAHLSVARGLLALIGFSPTWIMQRAGQDAHLWPGFREQPIFTRHVKDQFDWLKPVFLRPSWLFYYLANSRLGIGSNLQAAMIAAVVDSAGREALRVERQAEGVQLRVPQPKEFFEIPNYALQDLYNLINAPVDPETQ
jgi:hypothetical protein